VGVLSNLVTLTTMGLGNQRTRDVGAELAQAQATLDGLNAQATLRSTMGATTADSTTAGATTLVPATATVTSLASTGVMVNDGVQVVLQLLVMLPAGIPVPVSHTTLVSIVRLAQVQVGSTLAVRLNPAAPAELLLDLR
jgi:hypothetical protein